MFEKYKTQCAEKSKGSRYRWSLSLEQRHESRQIDNQSEVVPETGDPESLVSIFVFQDDLLRIFGSDN